MAMSNEILKAYTHAFKAQFPTVSAEAVICFALVAVSEAPLTVGKLAQSLGMVETTVYKELSSLSMGSGAGLVSFVNVGDGSNQVQLTPKGADFRSSLQQTLEGKST